MKIVCAWCQQEGQKTTLGEREPVADTTETHGICARHSEKLLEQVPSRSFPKIRVLFVVRATETAVYDHLTRSFAGLSDVAVITDRRKGERRRAVNDALIERRRANRRLRQVQFSSLGYLVVRFGPERERGLGRELRLEAEGFGGLIEDARTRGPSAARERADMKGRVPRISKTAVRPRWRFMIAVGRAVLVLAVVTVGLEVTVHLWSPNEYVTTGGGDQMASRFRATGIALADLTVDQTLPGETLAPITGTFSGTRPA